MPLISSNFSISTKNPFILIRGARYDDIPRIVEIEFASFKNPYNPMLLYNLLTLYPYGFKVAIVNSHIAGYIISRVQGGRGHILALATDPLLRGRGVASEMLKTTFDILKNKGSSMAWLEVRTSNHRAIKFYQKKGFEAITTVPGYYNDGEDALLLYKSLSG